MIEFVLGYPDSGKSERAENDALKLADGAKTYYVATMVPYGEQGAKRVEKHREARRGKGFVTVERPFDLPGLAETLRDLADATCLIECVSNLVGNEERRPGRDATPPDLLARQIADSILAFADLCANAVIVGNAFPGDAPGYDPETRRYVALNNAVNDLLKTRVDRVLEIKKEGTAKK